MQPGQQKESMHEVQSSSLMPYFCATTLRALHSTQAGKQPSAQQHVKHEPRLAFSMAEPKMHSPPQYSLQQQPMPQSFTSQQPQMPVSH